MKKRMLSVLLGCGILVLSMLQVSAGNVDFDITSPSDPISIRTPKDDQEQLFYVTGNYFSFDDTLVCISYKLENPDVYSNAAPISRQTPSNSARYRTYAIPGVYYFMHGYSYYTGLRVTGRYCP